LYFIEIRIEAQIGKKTDSEPQMQLRERDSTPFVSTEKS
jgi:hypothetical protein